MTRPIEALQLLIPIEGLTPAQRFRAVTLGNRIETKVAAMLANGADPDRLLDWVEGYFPGGQ